MKAGRRSGLGGGKVGQPVPNKPAAGRPKLAAAKAPTQVKPLTTNWYKAKPLVPR